MPERTPCSVPGCGEPVQSERGRSAYCVAHANLIWRFHSWLNGSATYDVLSFDSDRSSVERGTWRVV